MSQPTVLQVVILRDGLLVGTEVFVPGQYTLGSADGVDLKLDDPAVDASHATLYFQNGRVAVQDSGSQTGVFVNGHKVTACEVRPVDEIACGPFTLKVRVLAQNKPVAKGPSPEVAALLGGVPAPARPAPAPAVRSVPAPAAPPPAKPAAVPATVVSSRRMNAAPAPLAQIQLQKAPHLKSVEAPEYFEDETATESIVLGNDLTADVPTRLERQSPAAPQAKAQPLAVPPAPPRAAAAPAPAARAAPLPPPPAPPRPAAASQRRGAARPAGRKLTAQVPAANEGKGAPRLFFELYWGEVRQKAGSFEKIDSKKPLLAVPDDSVKGAFPLWGFNTGERFVLATKSSDGYRVFVPPGAAVESRQSDTFFPLQPDALESIGTRKFISLKSGSAIRLSGDDDMTLVAYVQAPIPRPFVNPLRTAPWLLIILLCIFLSGFGAFIAFGPRDDTPDFTGKSVPPVAVRLIAPEPKKKEEAKKKLEELKKKEPVKKEKVAEKAPPKEKEKPKEVPVETKTAIAAVKKLTAAGPAIKDLLAAVDKLGNGPGRKDVKNDMKLSGLIGKQPIANAGLGSFGLGGGGSGGIGTKGMEILRGKGGSGIGALGAGNVGKGAVGGSVSRASARTVSAQGTIDKDAVAKVINSHLHEVSSCYERALLKEPGLAGKIVLEWGITTSGSVSSTKTKSSSMKSSAVEACIITAIKGWKFPAAKGAGVMISYPFMFNSVGY